MYGVLTVLRMLSFEPLFIHASKEKENVLKVSVEWRSEIYDVTFDRDWFK